MYKEHIILGLLWMIFCVLHSWFASLSFKESIKKITGPLFKYYRLIYTVFAFIFLAYLVYFQASLENISVWHSTLLLKTGGIILGSSGVVLMLICIRKYFLGLSGLLSLFTEKESHELIISGVHRYVRHPLYLGTFAFIWGIYLVFPLLSWLITDAVITLYTLAGIHLEEEKLIKEYGEAYRSYRQRVPMIIPFIKIKQRSYSISSKNADSPI